MIIDARTEDGNISQPFNYGWLGAPQNVPINRDFLPDDLAPHLKNTGVEKTIFVQTQHNLEENRWALGLAERHAFLAGVVGWVDLASPRCEEQLLEFRANPKFVGVRHITQDELRTTTSSVRPDILQARPDGAPVGHRAPFDLLFHAKHLAHAMRRWPVRRAGVARQLVIDHHLAVSGIKEHAGRSIGCRTFAPRRRVPMSIASCRAW